MDVESFYRSYDQTEIDLQKYIIRHYNIVRVHRYNNYLSPDATEKLIRSR